MESSIQNEVEEKRTRKKTSLDPTVCPVCSCSIRENELQNHFKMELEKLGKIKKISTNRSPSSTSPSTSKGKSSEASTSTEIDTWSTFQKIKENRVRRTSRLRNRKRKAEDQVCPVCSKIVIEDLQLHVELCLKSQQNTSDDESDGDIDVGESYTWCGQTRVRATTLVEGELSSTAAFITKVARSEEDTEVNIDGDDENQVYGNAQYSERDVIMLNQEDQRLRDLVIGEPATTSEIREENNQNVANNVSRSQSPSSDKVMEFDNTDKLQVELTNEESSPQIIESLKARIREYEKFIKNRPKCLICLDDFKNPVVSICCWHVHCEECWLYTLGCRKLCPQCNMITSAPDLRRIYL